MNPEHEYKFYDDKACFNFVEHEFPEYYDAYVNLPKNVERSDFFRILVVLKEGSKNKSCTSSLEGNPY